MKFSVYRVKDGEDLTTIAKAHNTCAARIAELNRLKTAQTYCGMRLLIESGTGVYHTVMPFETVDKIARKYGASEEQIVKTNALNDGKLFLGQRLFIPLEDGVNGD